MQFLDARLAKQTIAQVSPVRRLLDRDIKPMRRRCLLRHGTLVVPHVDMKPHALIHRAPWSICGTLLTDATA